MVTRSVRLPDELARRLDEVAKASRRTKSSFIVEALEDYLDKREDFEVALARFRDPGAEWLDHEHVRGELGLDLNE